MIDFSQNSLWLETGYQPLTTYWTDFNLANIYGVVSIKETYDNGIAFCKDDYKLLTEFVMVLNHQCWKAVYHNRKIAELYNDLFRQSEKLFFDIYGDDKEATGYYYRITD